MNLIDSLATLLLIEKIAVIGSGFAGLTSAIELASLGYQVTVLKKIVPEEEQESLKLTDLPLIWVRVGIT